MTTAVAATAQTRFRMARIVLRRMYAFRLTLENGPDGIAHSDVAGQLGSRGAGSEQGLDGAGVVAGLRVPAVDGAVHRPAERRARELIVFDVQLRAALDENACHLGIAVKARPVERGLLVLPARIDRPARLD